ncbi:MAG TPA: APC family permease [Solirubrobacteraceae bacterium]|nr:APC family permease [Solirubrobacteraceae bacterium]
MSATAAPAARRRVLGLRDTTLFTVSAIVVVDTLTASAAIGVQTIGWWILAIILFLVPSAMITAELGTAYPDQGGIYSWVRRAYGERWASRTTYWYYVNVALWMPAVFLLFTGIFCQLFVSKWADWEQGKWWQVAAAIAATWMVVLVGSLTLDIGKWVNNLGAILKAVIILALGVGGIVLAIDDGTANTITVSEAVPSLGDAKTYLPVIIFMMLGFELISSLSEEIKEPQKIIPRTLFTAGGILAFLYMFATIGILLALPLEDLGLVEGLVDTFKAIFGTSGFGEVLVYALGIAAMYTFFTNMTTWSMGANRSAQEAAAAGELPAILGREHPVRRTPVGAYVVSGTVATAVLLFAAIFVGSQDDLFYAIFSASAVVFLMPYLLMFPCVVTLRRKDPETPRPYRVPGGMGVLVAMSAVTTLIIFATFLLFLWPEIPNAPEAWSFTGPLLAIVGVTLLVGEVIVFRQMRRLKA